MGKQVKKNVSGNTGKDLKIKEKTITKSKLKTKGKQGKNKQPNESAAANIKKEIDGAKTKNPMKPFREQFKKNYLKTFKKMVETNELKLAMEDLEKLEKVESFPIIESKFQNLVSHTNIEEEKVPEYLKVFSVVIAESDTIPQPEKQNRKRILRKYKHKKLNATGDVKEDASSDETGAVEENASSPNKDNKKIKKRPSRKSKKSQEKKTGGKDTLPSDATKTASTKVKLEVAKEKKTKNFSKNKKMAKPKKPQPKKTS